MAGKYGIWVERDLDLEADASDVDRESLLDAQQATLGAHNQEVARHIGLFADFTSNNQASVKTGAADVRLQPLDEFGRPKPIKGRGIYFVGFPLWKAGTAEGYTFWAREQMTVRDYADSLSMMLSADVVWVRDQIFSVLFYNGAGFAYSDVAQNESVTVYGGANGDTVVYPKNTGAAIDDHYSAQANTLGAGADNPLDTIYDELVEHPLNAGSRIVAFIPPGLRTAMEGLAGFAPRPREIIEVVPAAGSATTDPLFAPALNLPLSATMEYIGVHGSTYVVVWQNLPANYMVTVAVDAQVKPLAARQYRKASLQGLINEGEPMSRFPYQQNNWLRALGFGGLNRTAWHVHRFGNGSYASPSGLSFPLA